ncbi:FAD-dependent pyridine nucleotide-disulfide oxidoreductase [Cadophora sp. MPI-SDFR-AT-0126]|nr:FAD-dependent pyridine nucleotide-disulfide oxidoreductase [Leotiomycetes sp. MPI-SDFR-AT-0126]
MSSIDPNHFDLLVLGSGEAGKYVAWTLASQTGKRCAVIERRWLGGSCPNIACLPSKNVVHTANVIYEAFQGQSYGILNSPDKVDVSMSVVRERKREMVTGLVDLHAGKFKEFGVELVWGQGTFVGKKSIEVVGKDGEKRVLTGDKIVISTGSRARIDDIPGLKSANPLTHIEILELDVLPSHLIILGGGYIGLEFAQAMRRLGAEVTVLERNTRLLKKEDKDIVAALQDVLENDGVKIFTSTTITNVTGQSGTTVTLTGTSSNSAFTITGSHILCATGRLPNTTDIGLEEAGITLTSQNYISTDENLETSSPDIYAVGDCAGSPNFTHIAYDDFRIVSSILLGHPQPHLRKSNRQVPFTLYTTPELAHVGLREYEAVSQGLNFRLAKVPMAAFLKTRTLGNTTGFAKALVADDDSILGFTALGLGAGELLPVVQLAMKKGLSYEDVRDLVITHPTLSEGLVGLFSSVPAK